MRSLRFSFVVFVGISTVCVAQDKGQCPGFLRPGKIVSSSGKALPHRKPIVPAEKPEQNAEYLGKIRLNAAISDKGYVCDAAVFMGVDPKIDEEILTRFKEKQFPPMV